MLTGSLLGGVIGQFGLLALHHTGRPPGGGLCGYSCPDTRRRLHSAAAQALHVRGESRRIFRAGVTFGWHSPVIRPLLWGSGTSGIFFIFAWYSWQPYILDLLGRDYVWLLGVVTAAFSLTGIIGNALVKRIMREGLKRREAWRVLAAAGMLNVVLTLGVAAVGLSGVSPGLAPAGIAIALWLAFGLVFGVTGPIRMAYINAYIPSAERATVLSLDSFFADAGGAGGQPALGWLSDRASIPVGWLVGTAFLAITPFLYRSSGRAAREVDEAARAASRAAA